MSLDIESEFRHAWIKMIESTPFLPKYWKEISANPNITMDLVDKYPNLPWDPSGLSANPNLTKAFVDNHPEWKWKLSPILANSALRVCEAVELVKRALVDEIEPPINIGSLLRNPSLTWDFLHEHVHIFLESVTTRNMIEGSNTSILGAISCHPSVTLKIIDDYPEFPWNSEGIAENPNLTPEFLINHSNLQDTNSVHIRLSRHPNFVKYLIDKWRPIVDDDDYIVLYGYFRVTNKIVNEWILPIWDWRHLSQNVTISDVKQYPNHPWDWSMLTVSNKIDITEIVSNPNLPWVHSRIGYRSDITPAAALQLNVDHSDILGNPRLPTVWFREHPDLEYRHPLKNPNLPLDWIQRHFSKVSSQSSGVIGSNPNPYEYFGSNTLAGFRPIWIQEESRRHMAAFRIHRFWRDVCWNPVYSHARKLLHGVCTS